MIKFVIAFVKVTLFELMLLQWMLSTSVR